MKLMSFVRASFLWVLLLPAASTYIGIASNQLVLNANHGAFPVQLNPAKAAIYHARTVEAIQEAEADGNSVAAEVIQQAEDAGMIDEVHCVMTKQTHLNWLADIFDLHTGIYSIGDFLLMWGDYLGTFCPFVWVALVLFKLKEAEEKK